jgi:hypothetical protein
MQGRLKESVLLGVQAAAQLMALAGRNFKFLAYASGLAAVAYL